MQRESPGEKVKAAEDYIDKASLKQLRAIDQKKKFGAWGEIAEDMRGRIDHRILDLTHTGHEHSNATHAKKRAELIEEEMPGAN